MEEQLVSLEVARLLEEKGFCNGSAYYYDNFKQELHRNGNDSIYINGLEEDYIEVPTQSLVQKWLREEKGIVLIVDIDFTELKCYYCNIYDHSRLLAKQSNNCITYEEALEEGLKEALKLI